jgi:hypothetical protein
LRRSGLTGASFSVLGRPWVGFASLAALYALLVARSAALPVDDGDVWWIAAAGRDVLESGHAPTTNLYSYTAPGHPWIMHELVFGLVYSRGIDALGPGWIRVLSLLLGTAVVAVAASSCDARSRHPASAALALLLLLAGCRDALFAPRPSHSSLLLPVGMTVLAFAAGWNPLRAVALVALQILWTNAHGSFPLGVVIVAVAACGEEAPRGVAARRIATALAVAAATLVSPYGWRLFGLVQRYLAASDATARIIHEHVMEFFPIWRFPQPFVNPFSAVALALLVLLAASALAHRRHVARAVLALLLIALGCYQARHVTLAIVVGTVLLHPEVDDIGAPAAEPLRRAVLPLALLPGLAIGLVLWSAAAQRRPDADWIGAAIGGPQLWRLATGMPDGAHVYVPFDASGVTIWTGAPRGVRVFYDSRNDCYPPDVALAAFALEGSRGASEAESVLGRYGTRFALVPEDHPVFRALSRSAAWTSVRRDGLWSEFERNLQR